MNYRVRHRTAYAYAEPVDLASHLLHLLPRSLAGQRVMSASIDIRPHGRMQEDNDYFGNRASWVFLDRPHDRFDVTVEARVSVAFPPPPPAGTTQPWEQVAGMARAGGDHWRDAEYLFDSPMAPADPEASAYAAESIPPNRQVLLGLHDLMDRMRSDFAFQAGVTTVATPVGRVLRQRAGACQDFAHLMIAGLRALGLPARYVSGYLRTRPPQGQEPRRGIDQSHAWVGCWLGPEHGWIDLDPTNDLVVQDEHVVLAWGRDYGDVSPVRGVILGGGRHSVTVGVDLEPA
jgi:transglutaminase-like putative cysteine protease